LPPSSFQIIPAIDVLDGQAVRLDAGRFERVVARGGDPIAVVRELAGRAPLLHLVDLNGARDGRCDEELVERVVAAAGDTPVQVGGGIRTPRQARRILAAGAARVVVGTAAFGAPELLTALVEEAGERLVGALDVRGASVVAEGWTRVVPTTVEAAIERLEAAGVPRLLCTAVARDGRLAGADVELLASLASRAAVPVLGAGGVRSQEDVERLERAGLEGAIVGRAVLESSILAGGLRNMEGLATYRRAARAAQAAR
jgi:phosphoribosylformimino-5-aminoimidazole carboxamide ribotide isomerase